MRAEEIRRYASERIGLKENRNYTRYKELERDSSGERRVRLRGGLLRPRIPGGIPSWGGSLIGAIYEKADAQAEAARLKAEGWDVVVRPVDSFSTLGFSRDPLYSFMKSYSAFELASLILHEQTHATLFVKGQTQFSEELASLVGEEGALAWLGEARGPDSPDYRLALDQIADGELFVALLRGLAGTWTGCTARPCPGRRSWRARTGSSPTSRPASPPASRRAFAPRASARWPSRR